LPRTSVPLLGPAEVKLTRPDAAGVTATARGIASVVAPADGLTDLQLADAMRRGAWCHDCETGSDSVTTLGTAPTHQTDLDPSRH
jgi:hypothetical protein